MIQSTQPNRPTLLLQGLDSSRVCRQEAIFLSTSVSDGLCILELRYVLACDLMMMAVANDLANPIWWEPLNVNRFLISHWPTVRACFKFTSFMNSCDSLNQVQPHSRCRNYSCLAVNIPIFTSCLQVAALCGTQCHILTDKVLAFIYFDSNIVFMQLPPLFTATCLCKLTIHAMPAVGTLNHQHPPTALLFHYIWLF